MTSHAQFDPQAQVLFDEFARWPIFDPHSHIDPHRPAARDLDEILGYHYYTELAHSAGMPAAAVAPEVPKAERVRSLAAFLDRLDNTVQHSWLTEIAATFHDFRQPIDGQSVGALERAADRSAQATEWDETVWKRSNLEAVFLTNDFDDPLDGWDTSRYVPCLRVDDLVLKLHEPRVVERLSRTADVDVTDTETMRAAIAVLFERFVSRGARACAVSLPPDFAPRAATHKRGATPLRRALRGLPMREDERDEVRCNAFWIIAELCAEYRLPFDLMIGPIRNIYPGGVAGGRDLFDRRVSLHAYAELFRAFPGVTFPVSTLSPDAGAELVAYAWIFPNVVPMGHWWYSNLPEYIGNDLRGRLQGVPKTKLVGYYSDAYKLEFILPKFNMYRRVLAEVLAGDCIRRRGWSEAKAISIGRTLLIDNPKRVFGANENWTYGQ